MSIPGESEWVQRALHGPSIARPGGGRSKRGLEEDEAQQAQQETIREQENCMDCDGENSKRKRATASEGNQQKGAASGVSGSKPPAKVEGASVQHAAIVKMYDADAEDCLKVNELVEVVGVLAVDAVLVEFPKTDEGSEVCACLSLLLISSAAFQGCCRVTMTDLR